MSELNWILQSHSTDFVKHDDGDMTVKLNAALHSTQKKINKTNK